VDGAGGVEVTSSKVWPSKTEIQTCQSTKATTVSSAITRVQPTGSRLLSQGAKGHRSPGAFMVDCHADLPGYRFLNSIM
jgi:hypothetical protein